MAGSQLVYMKSETHIRLKALAHLDNRNLLQYIDQLSREAADQVSPKALRQAIEAVTNNGG